MRFAIPAHADERPPWQRARGCCCTTVLASRRRLPASATVDISLHPIGDALQRPFGTSFEYSDCMVVDFRLVVLSAVDAAGRGAAIRTGARCARADRGDTWRLVVIVRRYRRAIRRALVIASGAWTATVADRAARAGAGSGPHAARPDRGSAAVDNGNVYVFQNSDRRFIFASPYAGDFTLIGSVGHPFKADPAIVAIGARDVACYFCEAANRYFRVRVAPADVVPTVSGANAVLNRLARARRGMTFDYRRGKAPLITLFGVAATTARLRAESRSELTRSTRCRRAGPRKRRCRRRLRTVRSRGGRRARPLAAWRGRAARHPPIRLKVEAILGDAKQEKRSRHRLRAGIDGRRGALLMKHEWARFPDDILWRRSKLGLTMPPEAGEALAASWRRLRRVKRGAQVRAVQPRPTTPRRALKACDAGDRKSTASACRHTPRAGRPR